MTTGEIQLLRQLKSAEIKQHRMAAGICKSELARQTGLCRQTIDVIERGERAWTVDTEIIYLQGITKILSLRPSEENEVLITTQI
jgi:DNA-binding XRE family transcriptional regulator